jgi:hypothetical protein
MFIYVTIGRWYDYCDIGGLESDSLGDLISNSGQTVHPQRVEKQRLPQWRSRLLQSVFGEDEGVPEECFGEPFVSLRT